MDQDEQLLYEAFTNYASDGLFWSLIYLNNAVFGTDFAAESRTKLLSLSQMYETIMLSIYPYEECGGLVEAMKARNQVFVDYVDCLLHDSPDTQRALERWRENGQRIALLLSKLNPFWKPAEWSALVSHEAELMEAIAVNMKAKNYSAFVTTAPVCRRLAMDMSKYMCSGIIQQRQCDQSKQ